eukprot:521426-Hanusia_phi.AAC.2
MEGERQRCREREQARAKLILDFEAWYKHEYEVRFPLLPSLPAFPLSLHPAPSLSPFPPLPQFFIPPCLALTGRLQDEDELNGADTVDGEVMDDAEKFDRLEVSDVEKAGLLTTRQVERVMAEDPDSLAYHNAAKNVRLLPPLLVLVPAPTCCHLYLPSALSDRSHPRCRSSARQGWEREERESESRGKPTRSLSSRRDEQGAGEAASSVLSIMDVRHVSRLCTLSCLSPFNDNNNSTSQGQFFPTR